MHDVSDVAKTCHYSYVTFHVSFLVLKALNIRDHHTLKGRRGAGAVLIGARVSIGARSLIGSPVMDQEAG